MFDLILKNGSLVTHAGRIEADIGISKGKIKDIGQLAPTQADNVIDVKGLTVLPGVVDSQVHFREPGLEYKEDLESGTRGAVLGGVTAVFEMPNTKPSTLTADDLDDKFNRAKGRAWCDYAFYVGCAVENIDKLAELERRPGVSGVKIFMGSSTGNLLVADDATLLKALQTGRRRVAIHAEDEYRLLERKSLIIEPKATYHPIWRDEMTGYLATERIVRLARQANRPIHVLHITTEEEMDFLGQNKDIATVEVLPQHLTLHAPDCYERFGTLAQMNPPIREKHHQDALWRAVQKGIVDVMGSDHAPHTLEEKMREYPASPSGLTGVQTLVPLMLNHVNQGRLSLERFVDLTSAGPLRVFGMAGKGRIAIGYDADFTIVDMKRSETIHNHWIASKAGWTVFDGMKVQGWPVMTMIRGTAVMRDGALAEKPAGEPIKFIGQKL